MAVDSQSGSTRPKETGSRRGGAPEAGDRHPAGARRSAMETPERTGVVAQPRANGVRGNNGDDSPGGPLLWSVVQVCRCAQPQSSPPAAPPSAHGTPRRVLLRPLNCSRGGRIEIGQNMFLGLDRVNLKSGERKVAGKPLKVSEENSLLSSPGVREEVSKET